MKTLAATLAAVGALTLATSAHAATVLTVPGTANPFLAGAPNGGTISWNGNNYVDTAPAESPVAYAVTAGEVLKITATGSVGNCDGCQSPTPDGGYLISSNPIDSTSSTYNTFVQPYSNLPINSLVGVFNAPGGDDVLEIGSSGTLVVPTGATELYFGTVDGYQWNNNVGSFNVTINTAVPEPSTWALMLIGFGMVGVALRKRYRTRSTVSFA